MPLQIRRGTDAERQAMTVPLAAGEPLFTTDEGFLYIGNANTLGGVKVSGYADEDAIDAVGLALVSGSNSGITFIYGVTQDNANRIDATVNISQLLQNLNLNGFSITGTGNINIAGTLTADFKGSVFGDDSTPLIDGVDSRIHLDGTVKGNIVPDVNVVYDIGSTNFRFRDLYLSGSSIELGAATITATGSSVNLPAGSTVGGVTIGTGSGNDDYSGNIIGDDSTIIVNTRTNTVSGTFVGDLRGSVFGDDSTSIVDGITRELNAAVVSSEKYRGSGPLFLNLTDLKFDDTVQERITLRSATDGLITGQGLVLFRNYKGTNIDNPVNTVADDFLGGFVIEGYYNSDYVNGSSVFVKWDADADFNFAAPKSTISITSGNNSNSFPNFLTFDGRGVLNAPIIKATSYPTASLPAGPEAGWIIFDSTSNEFKGWNGSSWVVLG